MKFGIAPFVLVIFNLVLPLIAREPSFVAVKGRSIFGVSGDGNVAVGSWKPTPQEAFHWTLDSEFNGLGGLSDASPHYSVAMGVSTDGSIVVGNSRSDLGRGHEAFIWTTENGMQRLGFAGQGLSVSDDGTVVGSRHQGSRAFRWNSIEGYEDLGELRGVQHWATDISSDGRVIVGTSALNDFESEAFVWTRETGMLSLDDQLTGEYQSEAVAVSSDGSTIVGYSGDTAYSWSEATGMVDLGMLPGMSSARARGVSGDGSVIVGTVQELNPFHVRPFLWDASHGMRDLTDVLNQEYDLELPDLDLTYASDISADGNVIVGRTTTGVSWIATIPEPGDSLHSLTLAMLALSMASRRVLNGRSQLERL